MPASTSKARTPPRKPRARRPPRLIETPGPDPATALEDVRLAVGTLVGVHGVHGELKLRLSTDDPERLQTIKQVYLGEDQTPRRLLGVRFHAGMALIRLTGIATPEAGMLLRGQTVRVAGTDVRPPAPGEFFLYQVLGLEVVDEAGNLLGQVTDVMETGAHDVFVVSPSGGGPDILLPNHPEVVLDIRPSERRMTVRPLVYDA